MNLHAVIEQAKKDLQNFKEIYVMFSGGKDSLVALHLTKSIFQEKTKALFINTGIPTPGVIDYVKETCKELNVELTILEPKYDYFELVNKIGFPTITRRWCKYYLKLKPLKEFTKDKKKLYQLMELEKMRVG